MRITDATLIDGCLQTLAAVPAVRDIHVLEPPTDDRGHVALRVETATGAHVLDVEAKRTHLTRTIVDGTIAHRGRPEARPWILMAPYVGRHLGDYLDERDVNYVDLEGNCRLRLHPGVYVHVTGRRRPRDAPDLDKGIRAPGYQVLFTILARPGLLDEPVRTVAEVAGVGKTAVAERLRQLRRTGLLTKTKNRHQLIDRRAILDQWLTGYETVVRPKLLLGRFTPRHKVPPVLEQVIEAALEGETTRWAWGGGAAAKRLTGHHRGEQTVLHLERRIPDLPQRIQALPDRDGTLTVLGAPGPVAFDGVLEKTVHPLLVYTELLAAHDDRMKEAALAIWNRYLEPAR